MHVAIASAPMTEILRCRSRRIEKESAHIIRFGSISVFYAPRRISFAGAILLEWRLNRRNGTPKRIGSFVTVFLELIMGGRALGWPLLTANLCWRGLWIH